MRRFWGAKANQRNRLKRYRVDDSEGSIVPNKRRSKLVVISVATALTLLLSGCSTEQLRGYLPGVPGVTNHTDRITGLWTTSWIVLLIVGLIAWGLMTWAIIVYRRRKTDTGLPVQLRYNNPIETLFTVIPLILVIGFLLSPPAMFRPLKQKSKIRMSRLR